MDKFFPQHIAEDFIERLDRLSGNSVPCWGKMTAAQMLAHCCEVTREALGEKKITMVELDNETRKKMPPKPPKSKKNRGWGEDDDDDIFGDFKF